MSALSSPLKKNAAKESDQVNTAEMLKPDPFLVAAEKAQKYATTHQQSLILGLVGVVVLGIVGAVVANRSNAASGEASAALAELQKLYDRAPAADGEAAMDSPSGEKKFATTEEWQTAVNGKLQEVTSKYGSTSVGNIAHLYLANLAMNKGDAVGAEKHLRDFQAAGGNADLATPVLLSIGATLEDQKKFDDALKLYAPLIPAPKPASAAPSAGAGEAKKDGEKSTDKPFADEALFRTARILEQQGKGAEARAKYEQLTKDFATSSYRFKAQTRLSALPAAAN